MNLEAEYPLRILFIGAGAIGSYVGVSLAIKGHQVVFLEQPEVQQRLLLQGLSLEIDGQVYHLQHPLVIASLEEALIEETFDVAILAIKAFDTDAALSQMEQYKEKFPPVLCLQNGVENETKIEATLGHGKAIPGTVTSALGKRPEGIIVLEKMRGMGIAGGHPLAPRLVEAFSLAGLNARLFPDGAAMKWSKMLTNLLANATSAILDMTPAEVFAHPGLFKIEINQLREAVQVMRSLKLGVVDLPRTPVRALAFAAQKLPLSISQLAIKRAVGTGRGGKMPSFHLDLHARRGKSEVDYLNGAVVRFGERLGVATPVNNLLNQTLISLTEGKISIDSFRHQPEKLARTISSIKG